ESQARRIPITAGTQRCHPPLPRPHQRKPKTLHLDQGPKQNYRRCQTRAPSVRFDPLEWLSTEPHCCPCTPMNIEGLCKRLLIGFKKPFYSSTYKAKCVSCG